MAVGQAPTADIGTPDLAWAVEGQGLQSQWWETTADLVWPNSVTTYARMRHDPQLKAVLAAYWLPLLRANWALDSAGCRDEVVQHCSDDLGIGILGTDPVPGPARRRGVIWQRHLLLALHHLIYGHMPFELRYRIEGKRARLDHLGPRMPWTLAEINLNRDATIREVVQSTQQQPLPADRLIWYVTGQEGANWAGISMLRPAYGAWLLKHETWRVHATSIRRWGMGVPSVEAPPGATAAQVAQAQQLASSMRAGDQAGVGLPQGFKPSLIGITGSVPDALAFIEYLDRAMAKMVLAGLIELGQTETGSRALGETFLDLFLMSLQAVADEMATTATSGQDGMPGIVTNLVDTNWGEDEPAPRVVCTDVGSNYMVTADAIQALVSCGAITADKPLQDWLRKTWRLPEAAEPPPQAPPPAPALPGGAGQRQGGPGQSPPVPGSPPAREPQPRNQAGLAASAGVLRRAISAAEQAAGFDPESMQASWRQQLDSLIAEYRRVTAAWRADLVDQVEGAVGTGRVDKLATLTPDTAGAEHLITGAMSLAAQVAAGDAITEAARQGVTVPAERVKVDAQRMTRLGQVWAGLGARREGRAAGVKAAQVVTAAPVRPQSGQVGQEVATHLDAQSDAPLRDELGAALTAGQNAGRMAVFRAAAESGGTAQYVASEILDANTCAPCRDEDGHTFSNLGEAEAAYPTGGFLRCQGMMRCRGTVIALWSPQAQVAAASLPRLVMASAAPLGGVVVEAMEDEAGLAAAVDAAVLAAAGWDEARHPRGPGGRFAHVPGGGTAVPDLTVTDYEGTTGNRDHITRTEKGLMPTGVLARMPGARGEKPGEHRNRTGADWEAFKADIAAHGIKTPVFITVDHGGQPVISEGSHRRDAAVELGLPRVPVEIRYFGHAEQQGTVAERAGGNGWTSLDFTGMDSLLNREFHPRRLEARQARHPRSGYMVAVGTELQTHRPVPGEGPSHPDHIIEGPPVFDVYDNGSLTGIGLRHKTGQEPITEVYRGMSASEWAQAQRRGYIQSDERGTIGAWEGTNAATDPRDAVSYLPSGPGVVVKIKVRPQDKWFTINADQYIRTRARVPVSQVEHVVQFRRSGKYDSEFAARRVVVAADLAGLGEATPQAFSRAFGAAFKGSPYSAFVNHYTPAEIKAGRMIPVMAEGGKVGALVHDHGDGRIEATALFSTSAKPGAGVALLRHLIDAYGVNYVECFGPVLPRLYATVGFSDSDVYPFDPAQAPPRWDLKRFDSPDYHLMRLPAEAGRVAAAAAEGGSVRLDVGAAMSDAADADPAWWDQYGTEAATAALVVLGALPPTGTIAAGEWRENLHPRDAHGQFTHGPGQGGLAAHVASGVAEERKPTLGGLQGQTGVVTFADGARAIHKRGMAVVEFDHEEFAWEVAEAIGDTGAAQVLRTGPQELYEDLVAGVPAAQWMSEHGRKDVLTDPHDDISLPVFNTDRALRIGLLDLLTENQDRHWGNWFVAAGDLAEGIDHSTTFGAKGGMPGRSPFMLALTHRHPGHFTAGELDRIEARLEAKREKFRAAGHDDWWRATMKNLADFREMASQAPGAQ